jgi:hypothetical protein
MSMIAMSMLLNILVLAPVVLVLATNGRAPEQAWGLDTPARRILAAIYAAILSASVILLAMLMLGMRSLRGRSRPSAFQ